MTRSSTRPGATTPISGSTATASASAEPRTVNFPATPVTSESRQLTYEEEWAMYNYEMHARSCQYCHDAYAVHRSGGRLCSQGHAYAQSVAAYVYSQGKGSQIFSATQTDSLVHVEVPYGYVELRSLLRAMERSLRHSRQEPIVSYDRSYYVAPRRRRHQKYLDSGEYAAAAQFDDELEHSPSDRKHRHHRHSTHYDDYRVDIRKPRVSSSGGRSYRHSGVWG